MQKALHLECCNPRRLRQQTTDKVGRLLPLGAQDQGFHGRRFQVGLGVPSSNLILSMTLTEIRMFGFRRSDGLRFPLLDLIFNMAVKEQM